jgi:hypothetical protein
VGRGRGKGRKDGNGRRGWRSEKVVRRKRKARNEEMVTEMVAI